MKLLVKNPVLTGGTMIVSLEEFHEGVRFVVEDPVWAQRKTLLSFMNNGRVYKHSKATIGQFPFDTQGRLIITPFEHELYSEMDKVVGLRL